MDEGRRLQLLAASLTQTLGPPPAVAVVLGSGWKEHASGLLQNSAVLDLQQLEGWPLPRVVGHAAELRVGELDGVRTALCGGRVHAYEGYSARELVRGVRALVTWGARNFLLLNAAGSLRPAWRPGSLMPFTDHLNFGLPNPERVDQSVAGEAHFPDLVDLYDAQWRQQLLTSLPEVTPGEGGAGIAATLHPGVYAGMPGPCYETPAEVRMLQGLGADAVGMSTIPEAIAAKVAGARVLAISLLSNLAAGLEDSRPSHQEVLECSTQHARRAAAVLRAAVLAAPVE